MIVRETKGSSGNANFVVPEDADDLFTLRRVIERNDYVIADTTRVIKQVKEFARPDKGERVKVRVSIRVDNVALDEVVDRLRISGIITNTDNDLVPKGTHHSITVEVGDMITIDKDRRWKEEEKNILRRSGDGSSFILVAIDTQEAAIAKVLGTHVKIIPNIYSGQSGKRYQQSRSNQNLETFFEEAAKMIRTLSIGSQEADGNQGKTKVLIFGPGETRRRFYNFLVDKFDFAKDMVLLIDGMDVAGEDGIFVFLRSPNLKEVMSSSKLAAVSSILDDVMRYVNRGEAKYAIGFKEVSDAASIKAIDSLVFSDSVFKAVDEQDMINLLNSIESYGAKTFAVDTSTDIGLRVSSLGGLVAILRYAVR